MKRPILSRRSPTIILAVLSLCMALQMIGFVMIQPLFARRFESFGAGVSALGLSATAYALTTTLSAPFVGMLADRFGRRPVVLVSLTAYVLAFSGYLLASSAWALILLRGLAGIFTAGLVPAITSMVGDVAPLDRRAQWIGIVNGGSSAGWIFGPLLGGFLYDRFGYVTPFSVSAIMAAAALLLALLMVPETRTRGQNADRPSMPGLIRLQTLHLRKTFLLLMAVTFGEMLAWAFIEPQLMFYAYDDLGWSSTQLGLVVGAYGLAFMTGEFFLGRLSDSLGRKPMLVLGLALFPAQFFGLLFSREMGWIIASFFLSGLGNALYDPALNALLLDITPGEQTAGIFGIKSTVSSLGSLFGPALMVLAIPFLSPKAVFLFAAVFLITIMLATAGLLRTPNRKELP